VSTPASVEIDVLGPDQNRVAGPLSLNLTPKAQRHAFDGSGWPRGEYWLRARVTASGKAVSPFLVRQFWKEVSTESWKPRVPLRPAPPQYLVDDWIFAASVGLQHRPDSLERLSDGPVVKIDRPWEEGSYIVKIGSLSWDERSSLYRSTYLAGVLPADPIFNRVAGSRSRPRYLCLTVSRDGVHWEKPELGRVEFQGSKQNNILRDLAKEDFLKSGEFDSYPYPTKERPIPQKYRFRMYDRSTDGPVDMDNFVLRFFSSRNVEPGTTSYGFGYLSPAGHTESDTNGQLYLGAVLHYNLVERKQRQELVWSRDRVHWHRFGGNRIPLLANGPAGSPDAGFVSGMSTFYPVSNTKGQEEWWFPYLGGSVRYMLASSKDTTRMKRKSLDELGLDYFKKSYPQYELAPFFSRWKDFLEESKASIWVPALARCKAGRLAHVEPVDERGEFTTHPLVLEGSRLLLNAHTLEGGSVRVELQDSKGNAFPGLSLEDGVPFSGDEVGAEFSWRESGLEETYHRVVLDKAHLYSLRIAQ